MQSTLKGLPPIRGRKVGLTSSRYGLYARGDTRATMAETKGSQPVRGSKSQKFGLSSDRSLQLDCVKLESLVIAGQPYGGEYVPGPCTHRPSSQPS